MNLNSALTVMVAIVTLGVNPLSARDLERGEWSVRLLLSSSDGKLEDTYNRLGQLHDASDGFDRYDLPELDQSWAGTYLSVIFYRPQWETDRESFNTDFHPKVRRARDEWYFEVRSDDPYRELSLTWVGKRTRMKRMVLVDLEDSEVLPAVIDGVPQVYNFIMNGPVREFVWRVLTRREYAEFLASGELGTPSAVSTSAASPGVTASTQKTRFRSVATDDRTTDEKVKRAKSGWLPRGWGRGEGKGYRHSAIPNGLPDDPFAD